MVSMLIGRPVSAIAGLFILILMSRWLTSQDYGIYFSLWAILEIFVLGSNLGLLHAVYRFVHSRELVSGEYSIEGPVNHLILWRIISLIGAAFAVPIAIDVLIQQGEIAINNHLVVVMSLIVFLEGVARFFECVFDSLLRQSFSQATTISRTLMRLSGVLWFGYASDLSLENILIVEVVSSGFGVLLASSLFFILVRGSIKENSAEKSDVHVSRMIRFALPAFAAQLLTLAYGPDALKLVIANYADVKAVAEFGFAYSLASVLQRYLPVNILGGVFRPVFVEASKRDDSSELLGRLISICIKLNCLLLIPCLFGAYFSGSAILSIISNHQYSDIGLLLSIIVLGLIALSVHLTLSMYCLALENSWPPLIATATANSGLLIAVWLVPELGATGAAIAFVCSEVIWVIGCSASLVCFKAIQIASVIGSLNRFLPVVLATALISTAFKLFNFPIISVGVMSGLVFVLISWRAHIFDVKEISWIASVMPWRRPRVRAN